MSDTVKSILAGGFASTFAKTVVAPVERVRLILQTSTLFEQHTAKTSTGVVDSFVSHRNQIRIDNKKQPAQQKRRFPHRNVIPSSSSMPTSTTYANNTCLTSTIHPGREKVGLVRSLINVMRKIIVKQGFFALWRGNLINCIRVFPTHALRFSLFHHMQKKVPADIRKSFGGALAMGATSGVVTTAVTFPLDLIRTKLATDISAVEVVKGRIKSESPGFWNCATTIVRHGGFPALYRGLTISALEIMPYTAISLGGYDLAKAHFNIEKGDSKLFGSLGIGWAVGLVASFICYPLDTVKRHVMLSGDVRVNEPSTPTINGCRGAQLSSATSAYSSFSSSYLSSFSSSSAASPSVSTPLPSTQATQNSMKGAIRRCSINIYKKHGIAGFYRGCLVNLIKSPPAAAITLVANDKLRHILDVS